VIEDSNFRFTAPSQWMRELFFHVHGIRPYFVPNAVFLYNTNEVNAPSKRFMMFVANHPETNPYKDFATLKKAWIKANGKLGNKGLDLVVIGGKARKETYGEFHIHFLAKGDSEMVYSFMKKAEILIQASKQDNAPLTILEAHSLNTKVIASLVGGVPELLSNQERRWLAETGNVDQLANSIVSALNEPEAIVPTHPKVESMAKTYLGHYYDLSGA
jgi:glycosyltransferase involved in cell wall biosynthesis